MILSLIEMKTPVQHTSPDELISDHPSSNQSFTSNTTAFHKTAMNGEFQAPVFVYTGNTTASCVVNC
jgi:hypothetical protein